MSRIAWQRSPPSRWRWDCRWQGAVGTAHHRTVPLDAGPRHHPLDHDSVHHDTTPTTTTSSSSTTTTTTSTATIHLGREPNRRHERRRRDERLEDGEGVHRAPARTPRRTTSRRRPAAGRRAVRAPLRKHPGPAERPRRSRSRSAGLISPERSRPSRGDGRSCSRNRSCESSRSFCCGRRPRLDVALRVALALARLARHWLPPPDRLVANAEAQVGTLMATISPWRIRSGLSSVKISFWPKAPRSLTTGLCRRSLYLRFPLCLITARRAVGVIPNLSLLRHVPKKVRCFLLGFERSSAQATILPFLWTLKGRFLPSATRWKPVTLPIAEQGVFGQSALGVCFVLPITFEPMRAGGRDDRHGDDGRAQRAEAQQLPGATAPAGCRSSRSGHWMSEHTAPRRVALRTFPRAGPAM